MNDEPPPPLPANARGGWPHDEAPAGDWAADSGHELPPSPWAGALDDEDEAAGILPDEVQQRWTRSRSPDGTEQVYATLRAEFVPGQRTASIHLAFCPPLAAMPELEFEQVDGPEARIVQGEVYRHGARLDIRLAEAAEVGGSVVVEVAALAAAVESAQR